MLNRLLRPRRPADRDPLADAAAHLGPLQHPVLIDGGAAGGATVRKLRQRFPTARIHAFEPLPQRLEHLRKRHGHDPLLTVHPHALGPEATTVTFNVTANLNSSSLLRPSTLARQQHGDNLTVAQQITVEQVRLDDALPRDTTPEVHLLKLDLQGYELHALRGATDLLTRTRAVLCEVEFIPLYEGQPLFAEIDQHLRAAGFHLHNLYHLWTLPTGQLTSADALFLR